jgi:hypothetical protein
MPLTPRRHAALLTLAAVAVLLVACNAGPSPSPSPTPRPSIDPLSGGFQGTVSDPEGAPIEGAIVRIEQGDFYGTVVTGPEGTFGERGVHGTFVFTVSHLDYDPAFRRIEVAPGQLVQVDFTLEPLATP